MREIEIPNCNRELLVEEVLALPSATFVNANGKKATKIRFLGNQVGKLVIQCPDDLAEAIVGIVEKHDATKESAKELNDKRKKNLLSAALKKWNELSLTEEDLFALVRYANKKR